MDRESLGALANAISDFQGGVVIISHNNEFVSTLCPEEWVMDSGHLTTRGEVGWMNRQDDKISDVIQGLCYMIYSYILPIIFFYIYTNCMMSMIIISITVVDQTVTDALGNTTEVKGAKKALSKRDEKAAIKAIKKKLDKGEELDDDEAEIAIRNNMM